MKCFILLAIVCATIGSSEEAISKEQAIEMFKKLANDCAAKEGASAADIDEAFAKKMPSTATAKCMHACIAETIGVMKDNKISVEGNIALGKMAFEDNPGKIQTMADIATECVGVTDANRCEAASKIMDCGAAAAKKRGVSFDDW